MPKRSFVVTGLLMLTASLWAAQPTILFEDAFDGKLAEGWTWLRENAPKHRISDGALEICLEPGDANSVKNALVRNAPDRSTGKVLVELTLTNLAKPTNQFEQAGITWYVDGKPVFKFVKELVDGQLMMIPGRPAMNAKTVQLRLVVTANSFTAMYRPDAKGEFMTAATGQLPPPNRDQVSIQGYHGPADAEHWVRFDDFRISKANE